MRFVIFSVLLSCLSEPALAHRFHRIERSPDASWSLHLSEAMAEEFVDRSFLDACDEAIRSGPRNRTCSLLLMPGVTILRSKRATKLDVQAAWINQYAHLFGKQGWMFTCGREACGGVGRDGSAFSSDQALADLGAFVTYLKAREATPGGSP
jgi:hypothetical protein